MKKLSVIVPIYNVEDYLLECLDSINESIRNIDAEVLLIDDGSMDGSSDIAVDYSKEHAPFIYYRKENGGLSDARNYGAKRAGGEFIAFADSDDIVMPDAYENMIRSAEFNQVDLVTMNAARITGKKVWKSTLHNRIFNDLGNLVTHISACENLLYDTTAWNKLIRRSFWEANRFQYPVGFKFEDMLVSLKMHWRASKVSMVREVGYLWREREGGNLSITQRNDSIDNLRNRLEMHEVLYDFVDQEIDDDDFRRLLTYKVLNFDLMIFMRITPALEIDKQKEYFKELRSFVDKYYDSSLEHRLFAECRQIYRSLAEGDYERIKQLVDYRKKGSYKTTPVIQTEQGYFLDLPQDLFSFSTMDMKDELKWKYPKTDMYKAEIRNNTLQIRAALFFPRINQPDTDRSRTKAVLENIITGERLSLKTTAYCNEKITQRYGFTYNRSLKKVFQYNYDGAGLEIEIDFDQIPIQAEQYGKYALLICYDDECRQGNLILENRRNDLFEYLDRRVILTGEKRIEIMHDPMGRVMFNISEPEEIEDHNEEMIWSAEEITEDEEQIIIKARVHGREIPVGSTVVMVYKNTFLERDVLITEGVISDPCQAVFKIEIGCDEFSETLTEGSKLPEILVGEEHFDLWSSCDEMAVLEKGVTRISMFGDRENRLIMKVARLREEDTDTSDKRRYMKDVVFKEFKKEQLNDDVIIFLSYPEDNRPSNSRFLYEYIDENHPEYKCIIILKDEKTPIKGKGIRVRKGSRDYYYYLTTAKYFVDNANTGSAVKRRSGQIKLPAIEEELMSAEMKEELIRPVIQELLPDKGEDDSRSMSHMGRMIKNIFRSRG